LLLLKLGQLFCIRLKANGKWSWCQQEKGKESKILKHGHQILQSLGDGRVTGFVTVNVDDFVDGGTGRWAAAGRFGRNPNVVNVDGAAVVATVCFGHPLMVEIVVGAVAADHSHQRLARRGHNVNLAGKVSNFFPLESFSGRKKRQNLADRSSQKLVSGSVGRNDVTPGHQKGRKIKSRHLIGIAHDDLCNPD
jgi:hypothetical protein